MGCHLLKVCGNRPATGVGRDSAACSARDRPGAHVAAGACPKCQVWHANLSRRSGSLGDPVLTPPSWSPLASPCTFVASVTLRFSRGWRGVMGSRSRMLTSLVKPRTRCGHARRGPWSPCQHGGTGSHDKRSSFDLTVYHCRGMSSSLTGPPPLLAGGDAGVPCVGLGFASCQLGGHR